MNPNNLTAQELVALVRRVFVPTAEDKALAFLVDLPDGNLPDNSAWQARREMVTGWCKSLREVQDQLGMDVHLYFYQNVRQDNADLPTVAWTYGDGSMHGIADLMNACLGQEETFDCIFRDHSILIAPTELSATAPLKMAAREYHFRAATMPGFSQEMIPALRLDYTDINRRCDHLKNLLDRAVRAEFVFMVNGNEHQLTMDLRYREAHSSGGLFPNLRMVGNLPSGESYIVPYEGEVEGEVSQTAGELPVQFGEEVVIYAVEENRAVRVLSTGEASKNEAVHLKEDPAYGNLAELGLGVLGDFGILPCGSLLLDEKLGLHIAFGRSDHFGGQVGPNDFSNPEAVVHIDRVYLPEVQPKVSVVSVDLITEDLISVPIRLIRDGQYQIDFGEVVS